MYFCVSVHNRQAIKTIRRLLSLNWIISHHSRDTGEFLHFNHVFTRSANHNYMSCDITKKTHLFLSFSCSLHRSEDRSLSPAWWSTLSPHLCHSPLHRCRTLRPSYSYRHPSGSWELWVGRHDGRCCPSYDASCVSWNIKQNLNLLIIYRKITPLLWKLYDLLDT